PYEMPEPPQDLIAALKRLSPYALAFGARIGVRMTSAPWARNTSSKEAVNLASWSRIRNLMEQPRSSRSIVRFRACWVIHSELGLAVAPATCTRLVPTSLKNNT